MHKGSGYQNQNRQQFIPQAYETAGYIHPQAYETAMKSVSINCETLTENLEQFKELVASLSNTQGGTLPNTEQLVSFWTSPNGPIQQTLRTITAQVYQVDRVAKQKQQQELFATQQPGQRPQPMRRGATA